MLQKFSDAETLDFSLRGYLVTSKVSYYNPQQKQRCNKTFKLNPVFRSNDTFTPTCSKQSGLGLCPAFMIPTSVPATASSLFAAWVINSWRSHKK
ncbi:MAG: hypothetical protein HC836_38620 [Richelia sp. RM2_1_2]|nr:hypothetical protein [Richelia sp. RM2_1_2]